ncbi:MAG: MotA/TolQ/ExbB proton channel family protein [Candidatus Cloacimonetes bacterium]|nr:MotA/TolQ/ExbB proton channel family protein [Candidatus Cloacimonadota bacterium]
MKAAFTRILLVISILLISLALMADDGLGYKKSVMDYYHEAGSIMHVISLLLVIMIVLAITKFVQLSIKERLDAKRFYLKLKGYLKNEQYEEAVKISEVFKKTTIGMIFWAGLKGFIDAKRENKTTAELRQVLQNSFDEAAMNMLPKIDAGIYWFDIIAQVATLVGLLGTIFGLITAFSALADVPEAEKNAVLTRGISTAMGTTAYGLIVAIPTMFVRGLLQGRAEKIINDIDEYSVKTINQIAYKLKG